MKRPAVMEIREYAATLLVIPSSSGDALTLPPSPPVLSVGTRNTVDALALPRWLPVPSAGTPQNTADILLRVTPTAAEHAAMCELVYDIISFTYSKKHALIQECRDSLNANSPWQLATKYMSLIAHPFIVFFTSPGHRSTDDLKATLKTPTAGRGHYVVIVNAGPDGVYNGQAFDMDLGDRFREHKDAAMEGEKKCFYDFWRAAGLMAAHQYLLIEMEPDDAGEFLRLRDGQHVAVSKLEAWYVLP